MSTGQFPCAWEQPWLGSAVPGASRASSHLSIRALPGPNCALDVPDARGWPGHEGSASVNDGLAATSTCDFLAVHNDAVGREQPGAMK